MGALIIIIVVIGVLIVFYSEIINGIGMLCKGALNFVLSCGAILGGTFLMVVASPIIILYCGLRETYEERSLKTILIWPIEVPLRGINVWFQLLWSVWTLDF